VLNILKDEKGSVMLLLTISLAVLIGLTALVVDGAILYNTKSKLQNAVDAAALAGAHQLTEGATAAETTAKFYLGQNNVDPLTEGNVSADMSNSKYGTDIITVTATRSVPLGLARIFGSATQNVTARAVAGIYPLDVGAGVMPIGVLDGFYEPGEHKEMVGDKEAPGAFGWLDLEGDHEGGANDIEDWIPNGFPGMVYLWDEDYAETGKMKDCIRELNDRIDLCTNHCTPDNIEPGCPRLVTIPLIDKWEKGQSDPVTIVGFAAFLLDDGQDIDEKNPVIGGYFIENIVTAGIGGSSATNYGVYGVKMLE